MKLFNRKPHVQLETFCTDFFDNQILSPMVAGIDVGKIFFDTVKKSIVEVNPSFAAVDDELLADEFRLLRFEMFGLAMLHTQGDKIAHHESRFTKHFLSTRGREDIWEDLINYNQIISKSAVMEFDANTEAGKWARLRSDKAKMDEFDKWVTAGFDGETVARVVNRRGSEKSWRNNITPPYLAWKLTERVGHELTTQESLFPIAGTIYGFYDGAKGAVEAVNIDV